MSLIFPFLSIIGETAGKVFDKGNIKWYKIGYKPLIVITFAVMFVLTSLFMIFSKQTYPQMSFFAYILVLLMIIFSALANITDIKGLSLENLSVREPFSNFTPLLGGLIGFFLFPSERNITILLFVIIGTVTLLVANMDKNNLRIISDRGKRYLLYSIIFEAIVLNIYKAGLEIIPAAWIFFFRMIGVFALTSILLKFDMRSLTKKQWDFTIYAGFAYFVGSLAFIYSIAYIGLLATLVIIMLAPALKYLSSYIILKEQVTKKQITASIILIILVGLAIYF